jgi:sugar phosphate permease
MFSGIPEGFGICDWIGYFYFFHSKTNTRITLSKPTPSSIEKQRSGRWLVGATGFLCLFSLVGIMFYGLPFFYDFWVKDFGWSRATVTSGNAFGKIIAGLFGFVAGWIIDRFGPRRLMLCGILVCGISVIALGRMHTLWQFYGIYIFVAIGYICGGPLPVQVLISRWFGKKRGKVMGLAYVGIGIGGMLIPQLAKALNQHFGWHDALLFIGMIMILIAFPIAWFVGDKPGNRLDDEMQEPDVPLIPVLKSRPFYLLAFGSMCSIAAVSGAIQNLKLFFSLDLHYSQQLAANILSLILFASIGGRLLMGWLADRLPKKFVMILISCLVALAISLLFFVTSRGVINVFAIIFGVGLGGDYMIIPLMAAELFGVKILGRVMGIILTADGFADALSPMLVGWLRDRVGNYGVAFIVLIGLAALGITAVAMLPRKRLAV